MKVRRGWTVAMALCFGCASAFGATGIESVIHQPNASYLSNTRFGAIPAMELRERLVTPSLDERLPQDYSDRFRDFEMRAKYGLLDAHEERIYASRKSEFAEGIFNEISIYQMREHGKRVVEAAKRDQYIQKVRRPIELAVLMAAIYSGEPVKFNVNESTRVTAFSNMPSQKGQVAVQSSWVNGSFDYSAGAPAKRSPYDPAPSGLDKQERYKLSLSRGLPVWGIGAGVTYGSTTQTMTTSLNKSLTNHLSLQVDSSRRMSGELDPGLNDKALQLQYGIRF